MDAKEFLKINGLEKSRRIVENAPKRAQRYFLGMYLKQGEWTWWWSQAVNKWLQYEKHVYGDSKFEIATDLFDLKNAIADLDFIKTLGGIELALAILASVENELSEYGNRLGSEYRKSSENPKDRALILHDNGAWVESSFLNIELEDPKTFISILRIKKAVTTFEEIHLEGALI